MRETKGGYMLGGLFSLGAGGLLIFAGFEVSGCDNVGYGGRLLFCSGEAAAFESTSGVPGALAASALIFVGVLLVFVGLTRLASGRQHH